MGLLASRVDLRAFHHPGRGLVTAIVMIHESSVLLLLAPQALTDLIFANFNTWQIACLLVLEILEQLIERTEAYEDHNDLFSS